MRPVGRIICFILVFIVFSFIGAVYAENAGQGTATGDTEIIAPENALNTPEKEEKKYFDPDLESILAVKDRSSYEFLSRLTPAEQHELYQMIKNRVDDEAGVTVSIMALVSSFVPAFISARFADKMEPATVARISDKVSIKKAIAIGKRLDPEFLADVAVYQDPKKVTAVVEGFPDEKLIDVTRILFQKGQYRVVAKFSDDLGVEKLVKVAEKINDPETMIEIARYMENKEKAVQTAVRLSDDYLLKFINLFSTEEDYELAAAVGREMEVKRQINMLNRLEPEKAASLASHYSPETIAKIMGSTMGETIEGVADKQLMAITRILLDRGEYKVVARFSDALSPEKLKEVAEKINDPATLIEIARHMENKDKLVQTAVALSDDYLLGFMNQLSSSDDYELAATVGRALDINRQINMLNRLEPEKAALLASHYPPDTIALIMAKSNDKTLADIARRLSPESMGYVSVALAPKDINRFINLVDRDQILAALPFIDLEKIQGAWPDLTPETRRTLKDLAKEYKPLAGAISKLK